MGEEEVRERRGGIAVKNNSKGVYYLYVEGGGGRGRIQIIYNRIRDERRGLRLKFAGPVHTGLHTRSSNNI